jgi:hypothetical protein
MPPITLDAVTEETDSFAPRPSRPGQDRRAADLLRSLRHGTNREFRACASRSAAAATPLLRTTLAWCARSCEPTVARRARYALDVIASSPR